MDERYYEMLRTASPEEYYSSLNDPEEELFELVWDLFDTVVLDPAEVFDPEFRNRNQFRFNIGETVVLEYFPSSSYFEHRPGPNPYHEESEAAGIHLQLAIQPNRSCLFSAGLQVRGRPERLALRELWTRNRKTLALILNRAQPMISTALPQPSMEHASHLEEMLDEYFTLADTSNFLGLQYPFAELDDTDDPVDFMVYMSLLYHAIKSYRLEGNGQLSQWTTRMKRFYSGRLPKLPPPLPSVELTVPTDR